jgi:hypothetical protein
MKRRVLFIVVLMGVFLRFFNLGLHSLWCDEFLAISLARLNFQEMFVWVVRNDAHPPLFYTIVHYIYSFTQSEFGLRFIPALFGTGAIVIFYLLLKHMRQENYLLPLLLFAFSPAAILWSQMVKSYSMLTFFSLLSVLMFFKLLNTRRVGFSIGWVLSTITAIFLHNYGILIFIAQILTLLIRWKELPVKVCVLPAAIILAVYMPYAAGPLFSQIVFVKRALHTVTNPLLRTAYTFYYFVFGETLSPLNLSFVLPGGLLFFVFFTSGLFSKRDVLHLFSLIMFIISVVMIFLVKATIPQNLIHLQPFFFLLVASGMAVIFKVRKRSIASGLLILFLLPSIYYYYSGNSLQYHDASKLIPYRQISRLIQDGQKPGEVVIFTEPKDRRFSEFFEPLSSWNWYYKGNLPLLEVNPASVKNLYVKLEEIYEKYDGFWLLLNYGFVEDSWNDDIRNFFLDGKSVKIKGLKMIKNYSFLDVLKGKGKQEYYFLEVYHIRKTGVK